MEIGIHRKEVLKDLKKQERYAKMKATILKKYGKDFYKSIGSTGGKNGDNRPFRDKEIASKAGKISAQVRKKK